MVESSRARPRIPWIALPILTVVWFGTIGVVLSRLWEYETTPGKVTRPPARWPADSRMRRNPDRPTLVVFAHPRCPCTRATIRELALIVAHCPERADVRVLFYEPSLSSNRWGKTDLWSSAEAIPGVTVFSDEDGGEARIFRATTSGHSMLYDPSGRLLFSGGITGSRGHSGDNAGRSAVESLLLDGSTGRKRQTFVFGCPLLGKEDSRVEESSK